jgi:hypothetical protein
VTRRWAERVLWALAVVAIVLAWARWRQPLPEPAPESVARAAAPAPAPALPASRLSAAVSAVAAGNPFRLDRTPAPIGFTPDPAPTMPQHHAPSAPPRPPLTVTGIVGPPWEALLSGVPGRDGAVVVKAGDVLGDLRVRSVGRETVVVQAPDTTWRLSVQRTWQ